MKTSLLIALAAILLTGCGQGVNSSSNPNAPASLLSITKHDSSAEPEFEDGDGIFIPVEVDDTELEGEMNETGLVDIMLDDAPLLEVITAFTRISGANIIASPADLRGRVTANLTGIDWHSALETILDMQGFSLTESPPGSEIYRIDPKVPGAPEPYTVKVIYVDSAKEAIEIAAALEEVLGIHQSTHIAAVPSRNAILVNGTASSHQQISDIMDDIEPDTHK